MQPDGRELEDGLQTLLKDCSILDQGGMCHPIAPPSSRTEERSHGNDHDRAEGTIQIPELLQSLIDSRLDTIDRMLLGRLPRGERLEVVREVESQIFELSPGAVRRRRTVAEDVLDALRRLDPPEAYLPEDFGAEAGSRRVAAKSFPRPAGLPVSAPMNPHSSVGLASSLVAIAAGALVFLQLPVLLVAAAVFSPNVLAVYLIYFTFVAVVLATADHGHRAGGEGPAARRLGDHGAGPRHRRRVGLSRPGRAGHVSLSRPVHGEHRVSRAHAAATGSGHPHRALAGRSVAPLLSPDARRPAAVPADGRELADGLDVSSRIAQLLVGQDSNLVMIHSR